MEKLLGVGSTWTMFARIMKNNDLEVFFCFFKKKLKNNKMLQKKKKRCPKNLFQLEKLYFSIFDFKSNENTYQLLDFKFIP